MWWNKIFRSKSKSAIAETKDEMIDAGTIKVVVLSDLGNVRLNNEDMGLFVRIADEDVIRSKGYLLIVADGMGGHNAGEVASAMAADVVSKEYFSPSINGNIEKNLTRAFTIANKRIFDLSSSRNAYKGMGTTCTALVIAEQSIYFAHAGDSRAYIIKERSIAQITQDHTYVQELVNMKEISAEEAAVHPKRNILTNAMGTKNDIRVDVGMSPLNFEINDRLLLCSDGLYDYLNDMEIAGILHGVSIHHAAQQLINEAKKRGGHDNITVVIAEKTENASPTLSKEPGILKYLSQEKMNYHDRQAGSKLSYCITPWPGRNGNRIPCHG